MGLKARIETIFYDALRMCENSADGAFLQKEIKSMLERIEAPLRVAVIGTMKAGKSTLMNALLKQSILITGTEETTYCVSWFKYGKEPFLEIVFRDGTTQKDRFENIEFWTARKRLSDNPRMNDVQYIVIYYPNEVLKKMELIDTPGLLSSYKTDSNNTLDFLGLLKEADELTRKEASAADAIVYAFTQGLRQSNADILKSFQGTAATTPINAIGVMTQADNFWDMNNNPLDIAASVIKNIMSEPQVQKLLYTTLPITAKLVEGAERLNERDWETLRSLSKLDSQVLTDVLSDKSMFCTLSQKELAECFDLDDLPYENICDSNERNSVCSAVGQYGVYVLAQALRNNMSAGECISYASRESGMEALMNIILQHFGNRSFLIKLRFVFTRLKQICQTTSKNARQDIKDICDFLYNEIDTIETTEQAFRELDVLQSYYNGQLKLKNEEELEEILQLTGERGTACEDRLGIGESVSIKELEALSKKRAMEWNVRGNELFADRLYVQAAAIMARSYDLMHYHLQALSGEDV